MLHDVGTTFHAERPSRGATTRPGHRGSADGARASRRRRRPTLIPGDLSQSLVAVVRRDVLFQALGNTVGALANPREGQVPFVVIDRYGTTVVFIEIGPAITAPGGQA